MTDAERRLRHVITYRLAYLDVEYTLCDVCVERDDHGYGTLGPVTRGWRWGSCAGLRHAAHVAEVQQSSVEVRS